MGFITTMVVYDIHQAGWLAASFHRGYTGVNMSVEKVVYLVRHGQSVDNASPVFQSESTDLSELGQRQAQAIASRLKNVTFEALIASPLPRTRQTAEAVSKATGHSIDFDPLFVERRKPKSIDGKPWTDAKAASTWREWEKSVYTPGYKVQDGENFDELIARAKAALDYLYERPEQSMVVVTHGMFLRFMLIPIVMGDDATGESVRNFMRTTMVENTGITVLKHMPVFEEKSRWRLWTLNDHSHFAE